MNIDNNKISAVKKLCKKYKVKSLSIFGSAVKGDFTEESDIDFAIDFNENDPTKYTDLYFEFKDSLEHLFKREIDLVELRGIKNSFFKKELEETKVMIYG